jgi:hypothetical protein
LLSPGKWINFRFFIIVLEKIGEQDVTSMVI